MFTDDAHGGPRPGFVQPPLPEGPTISVRLLWPVARVLGGSPVAQRFLSGSALGLPDLARPEARVPRTDASQLLAAAATALDRPLLGLEAGLELDGADLGPIEQAARAAPRLCDALQVAACYARLLGDSLQLALTHDGSTTVLHVSSPGVPGFSPHAADFAIGAIVAFLRRCAPGLQALLEVQTVRPADEHGARYAKLVGVRVRFGARSCALVLRRETLEVPMTCASASVVNPSRPAPSDWRGNRA